MVESSDAEVLYVITVSVSGGSSPVSVDSIVSIVSMGVGQLSPALNLLVAGTYMVGDVWFVWFVCVEVSDADVFSIDSVGVSVGVDSVDVVSVDVVSMGVVIIRIWSGWLVTEYSSGILKKLLCGL